MNIDKAQLRRHEAHESIKGIARKGTPECFWDKLEIFVEYLIKYVHANIAMNDIAGVPRLSHMNNVFANFIHILIFL